MQHLPSLRLARSGDHAIARKSKLAVADRVFSLRESVTSGGITPRAPLRIGAASVSLWGFGKRCAAIASRAPSVQDVGMDATAALTPRFSGRAGHVTTLSIRRWRHAVELRR